MSKIVPEFSNDEIAILCNSGPFPYFQARKIGRKRKPTIRYSLIVCCPFSAQIQNMNKYVVFSKSCIGQHIGSVEHINVHIIVTRCI